MVVDVGRFCIFFNIKKISSTTMSLIFLHFETIYHSIVILGLTIDGCLCSLCILILLKKLIHLMPGACLFTSSYLHRQKCSAKYLYGFFVNSIIRNDTPKGCLICRGHGNEASLPFFFETSQVVKEKNK